jgi:integrase
MTLPRAQSSPLAEGSEPTAILAAADRSAERLIVVLWRSGLRISEALALELRDVDPQAETLRVRHWCQCRSGR